MDVLKQQSTDLEIELRRQQSLVYTLQATNEALQAEIKQSRLDVLNAEQIVRNLSEQASQQEREQHAHELEERFSRMEAELREEKMRLKAVEYEKSRVANKANELDRQNTMLIAQFSEQFLPCYYNETTTEDEIQNKLESIQQIIQMNIRLQQRIEELESNNDDLPELDQAKHELEKYKHDMDTANTQIRRLQTSVEFYKMKYEELDMQGPVNVKEHQIDTDDAMDGSRKPRQVRSRFELDIELNRARTELASTSERLMAVSEEKQKRERAYEDLITQKNELVVQLHASKEALELKVQTQSTVLDDMEKRLNEVDKTNRKLDEQRIKTSAENTALKSSLDTLQTRFTDIDSQNRNYTSTNQELSSTLETARCELAELRVRCEALVDNEAVTQNVSSALDEFRSAYQQMDKTQLKETREQLDSVRKDNEILSNFVKAMNVQQMFAMDKLKTTLADAQLQREAYAQECTTLKQRLNTLQLEHDELTEKHTTLSQQLIDIDTSDATLESCRKQIQQLRNKISYLEKTVTETNAQAEKWNVQVNVSEQKCKTFKEITENLEKSLHESEEKSQRERNRLQELCDTANTQCQQSQTIIDGLRAEIADANARFTSREAELENAISEWKSQVTEMQQETLELNAQLDRLNRELMALRSHKQELESLFSQKQTEIADLTELKNALDDSCTEKDTEIAKCRGDIQTLKDQLANSEAMITEVRQGLQSEIDSLQQKIGIYEKAQLDDQGNRQSVLENVNQMLTRIASETDQMPAEFSIPDISNAAEMGKALEIIERMQREKKEEVNRRLQLIAEQQNAGASTNSAEEMVPMREYNSVVTKLRGQISAQTAEIQQRMQQIAELKMLEGLREHCTLLESELADKRSANNDLKNELKRTQESFNLKFKQMIQDHETKVQEHDSKFGEYDLKIQEYKNQIQEYDNRLLESNTKQEHLRRIAVQYKEKSEKAAIAQLAQSKLAEDPETSAKRKRPSPTEEAPQS